MWICTLTPAQCLSHSLAVALAHRWRCLTFRPLLSLCANGKARFQLENPGQHAGGQKAISYRSRCMTASSPARLRLGMVGGGRGAFIGETHRIAARLDDRYELIAGALSADPQRAIESGRDLRLDPTRCYTDWRGMAQAEAMHKDGIEVVSVVTPNASHHAICKTFLEAGIDVICDKPLTTTLAEAQELLATVQRTGRLLGVTYAYTGYPMVREAGR